MELDVKQNKEIIEEIKKLLDGRNKIKLIGKGKTAQYCLNDEDYYTLGIKQGIIFSDKQDILFLTDFEGIFGLENIINKIKYVVCPDFPHIMHHPNKNYSYLELEKYMKSYGFEGKFFVYQLPTTINQIKYKDYYFKQNIYQTTQVALILLSSFFIIKLFECYGINKGKYYHKDIINLDFIKANQGIFKDVFNKHYHNVFKNSSIGKKAILANNKKLDIYSKTRINKLKKIFEKLSFRYRFKIEYKN